MPTISYALTSLTLVKQFLGITASTNDALLENLINYVTTFIENACGKRRFLKTTYTELYDAPDGYDLFLRQYPIATLTSVKYRTGTIASPVYVDYNANDYLLYAGEGYIHFFTTLNNLTDPEQAIRVVYDAGYLIDFANITTATHTLPLDLTLLANELVGAIFNRRTTQGLRSESTEGQSVTYGSISEADLTPAQKMTVANYTLVNV